MGLLRSGNYVGIGVTIVSALAASLVGPLSASASSKTPSVAIGTLLTNTALGGYTEVGQVDMLSPSLGYALAVHPMRGGRYAYYLVRTTNRAKTWTVQSRRLFVDTSPPLLADSANFESDPSIDFVSRNVGYVTGPSGTLYATNDAGTTWSSIAKADSYGVSDATLSVLSSRCTPAGAPNYSCSNTLREYPAGSTVAEHSASVPSDRSKSYLTALLAVAPGPIQVVNVNGDGVSKRSSLLITRDGGELWRTLDNPCAGLSIVQLAVATNGEWLLSCFLDEGMSQGPAKVFRSSDQGSTWQTVLNDVHGTTIYYFFNGNDRVIFGASTNPAGGLASSTDGGTHWTAISALGNTGGAAESVVNFGPTSSLYQVSQGPMYVTRNDRTWSVMAQLPSGVYQGLSICTKHDVKVQLRRYTSGGLHYASMDFTNDSGTSCYLDGVPTMQPLNADGHDVGPAITDNLLSLRGDFVILKARRGTANVPFLANPPSSYGASAHCASKRASTVLIEFGRPSLFRVPLRSRPVSVCTTFPSIFTSQVRSGTGHAPVY